MIPETERMRLPPPPSSPRRPGIPLIAILAPVVMAGGLWLMTASPHALLFAVLGPVLAVAGWLDGFRTLRGERRAAAADARRRLDELRDRIQTRADDIRARLERSAVVSSVPPGEMSHAPSRLVLRLGTGALPSGVIVEGDAAHYPPQLADAITALRQQAARIDDAPVVFEEPQLDVVARGPAVMVGAFARALTVRAAAVCPIEGSTVRAPSSERWARMLPHDVEAADHWEVRSGDRRLLRVVRGTTEGATGAGAIEVILGDEHGSPARIDAPHRVETFRPALMCAVDAAAEAREIAGRAAFGGWRPASALPAALALKTLPGMVDQVDGGLAAALGVDADGPVVVDLDRDGPHALVAGTTGSGKSELLITWVLALARQRSPRELGLLLIDFKGGAAFEPLRELPHVVGIVSDLDPVAAARAVESLRAEVRRREAVLSRHRARSIGDLLPGTMSRLVIVVDEFAALVSLDAGLQSVFSDLAARGRSLGLHLIICTQRPVGIVRESVLANVTLRICLRVLDVADSTAVVGTPGASSIAPDARGRGVLAAGGRTRTVQFALAEQADVEAVAERWREHPRAEGRPWLDPLPSSMRIDELAALVPIARTATGGTAIGAVDLPHEQRRAPLEVDLWTDGALLVLGASGSGRSTSLDTLGQAVATEVRRISDDPAELWQALTLPPGGDRALVIADDLDRVLARADPEQRAELCELISRAARDTRRSGLAVAASSRTVGGAMHAVHAVFEQRLLLRLASREEHLLAGGELNDYRAERRPGSCIWHGAEAQIAKPLPLERDEWRAPLPAVSLTKGGWSIVTARPRDVAARLAAVGVEATAPPSPPGALQAAVADTDGWLFEHAALAAARREGRLLLIGCTSSDHRTLTRMRSPLPPLSGDDEGWLFDGVDTTRVRLEFGRND